jgi:hypothetical protein
MLILSFRLGMSMEVRRRQAGQVREGKLPSPLNRLRRTSEGNAWCSDPGPAASTCVASTPLNRPCAYVRGRGAEV